MDGRDGADAQSRFRGENGPALAVLSAAQFTTTLEFSVVFLALPRIGSELALGTALSQWVSSAYTVTFAGLLLLAGRVADRYAADRVFRCAAMWFAFASLLAATAPAAGFLLAGRAFQGAAAAFLQPAALGLLQERFTTPARRARAFAVWSATGAAGLALGTTLGGLLTAVSWRLTFAIIVPLMLACAAGGKRWLRVPRGQRTGEPIPFLAGALATATVLSLVCGLSGAAESGWRTLAAGVPLAVTVPLAAALIVEERRGRNVLVPRELRRSRTLRLGAALTALYMASLGSAYYLLTLLLQEARGRPPALAGVAFLPLTATVVAGGPLARRALRRFAARRVVVVGFGGGTAGLGVLALSADGSFWSLLPGLVLAGLGNGVVFTAMFVLGTEDVAAGASGSAGALLTTSQYVGSAVALACLVLVLGREVTTGSVSAALAVAAAFAAAGAVVAGVARR